MLAINKFPTTLQLKEKILDLWLNRAFFWTQVCCEDLFLISNLSNSTFFIFNYSYPFRSLRMAWRMSLPLLKAAIYVWVSVR